MKHLCWPTIPETRVLIRALYLQARHAILTALRDGLLGELEQAA